MPSTPTILSASATPTQKQTITNDARAGASFADLVDGRDGLQIPRLGSDGRSLSNTAMSFASRNGSFAGPGSFSADMRSVSSRVHTPRTEALPSPLLDQKYGGILDNSESAVAELREQLSKEIKIKEGSENLLEALNVKKAKQTKEQRSKVELELTSSNRKIGQLKLQIAELQKPREIQTPARSQMSSLFRGAHNRLPLLKPTIDIVDQAEADVETESPTFVLAEILQSLEVEGMSADYYVERANNLVELFKRNPNLKYDLAWSVFGLRVQVMLVSDSKEVIAAGYRMTRYAITDRKSLQTIRQLNTDYLAILSMAKEGKANVEREQALKFIRAFLDVKGGIQELSRGVVRALVAVAEQTDDRLRGMCIETLGEILVTDPNLLKSAGGIGPLEEVIADGSFGTSETLASAFLYLYDTPAKRKYLRSCYHIEAVFANFTDSLSVQAPEHRLRHSAKVILSIIQSWTGLMVISMNEFQAIRSLVESLQFTAIQVRNVLIDLFSELLRIKSPSWSSSFLAGRRLTTYGRVANLKSDSAVPGTSEESSSQKTLVDHYTALLLSIFLKVGLLHALLGIIEGESDQTLKRKATLLVSEILSMSGRLLPAEQSSKLQMLPNLFSTASKFGDESRFLASSTVYQIDSVNRTLIRSNTRSALPLSSSFEVDEASKDSAGKTDITVNKANSQMDESQFRSLVLESQVLNHVTFTKWRWDVLQTIAEGPLSNPKRFDEAKATKFIKPLMAFYRPFKLRFSNVKNTKPNQRYIKVGCCLIRSLLQHPEGIKYLAENKLLRQIAECLAQSDPMSGLTSQSPIFSSHQLSETLSSGYFEMLGVLSGDKNGLLMLERWRMINMCYHIIDLRERPDLAKVLLTNMDYSKDSHFRVMLSKALTACPKEIRIFATNILRRYTHDSSAATGDKMLETAEWAIRLLVNQLYDPEVEVCEIAVKILEEACDRRHHLEYVVKCRPALDHLGEIGAPLLLRFLSTSVGYHYLDDLDYISQEMDDWFLGRNDTYVAVVESSISKAMQSSSKTRQASVDGSNDTGVYGNGNNSNGNNGVPAYHNDVPPHFYRELTRTSEGCQLLHDKGHFSDFVSTIRTHGLESHDAELILKVKGCMWAVGNIGSMPLGGFFLEETPAVECLVRIAQQSQVMSMRGTAFFVLGLISRSIHGLEILDEFGWDGPVGAMGESLGFCLPAKLERLFSIAPWEPKVEPLGSHRMEKVPALASVAAVSGDEKTNARIVTLVTDLGNTVLTKKSVSELMRIKQSKPPAFSSPKLFQHVMALLESQHFRLPVRRFVIDLFEKSVVRRLVLEEDEEEEEEVQLVQQVTERRDGVRGARESEGQEADSGVGGGDDADEDVDDDDDDDDDDEEEEEELSEDGEDVVAYKGLVRGNSSGDNSGTANAGDARASREVVDARRKAVEESEFESESDGELGGVAAGAAAPLSRVELPRMRGRF